LDKFYSLVRLLISEALHMRFGKTTPILRSFDEAKTIDFYVEFLGFNVDWKHRFEEEGLLYMQISKDGCVLHLSEHHGDCCPGSAMRIEVAEIEKYQKELVGKKYKNSRPELEDTPWGSRDMSIKDPFGNKLVFTNAIST
jgi:uncharacterized glyoxalase superfamily protein PhnB